jgi:hypothetical protein
MTSNDIPEGYPDSPPEETIPPEPPISLDLADHELELEGEVEPRGAAPEADESDDAFSDVHDADELAQLELGRSSPRPPDKPNFNDNAAEWSRERP